LVGRPAAGWVRRVVLQEAVTLPPCSQTDVLTKVIYGRLAGPTGKEKTLWSTEVCESGHGVFVARTLVPDRCSSVPVRVMNVLDQPVPMERGTSLCTLTPVSV
jgi:hypothetical protein